MRIGSLFSGAGGLDLAALELFDGAGMAWHCEVDPAASKVLAHQWPDVPNLGDVTAIDWSAVEPVDILTGGFPCQDVSLAGLRAGMSADTRSGLWSHMAAAIDVLRPRYVLVENVRGLLSARAVRDMEPGADAVGDADPRPVLRALGAVLGDLADIGYDAEWTSVRASDVGACHQRLRVFILAHPADAAGKCAAHESVGGGELPVVSVIGAGDGTHARGTAPGVHGLGRGTAVVARGPVALLPTPRASDGTGGPNPLHRAERMDDVETRIIRLADQWGAYAAAIRRQELLSRPAPAPTEPNSKGNPRLSAAFVEWLMFWPAGWVTDPAIGLSRNDQLKICGNGVVPPQAVHAFQRLLYVAASSIGGAA